MKRPLFAFVALSVVACEDPLKRAQLLEEPRVLGVRVATDDDHASLLPGEPATFELLVAGPAGGANGRLAYQICEAAASVRGVPYCAAAPFVDNSADLDGAPIEVLLPETLASDARLALLGAVCVTGEPQLDDDPLRWSCSDGTAPLGLSFDARTGSDAFLNLNPDLAALQIRVGDSLVPLEAPDTSPTCADAAPSIAAGTAHDVVLELGEGARDASAESLQLSHFATAGEYVRTFSFVELGAELRAGVEWLAPGAETAVKHYVVVRDGRGGVSWATFSVCAR